MLLATTFQRVRKHNKEGKMKKLTFALVLLFTALLIGTAQGTEYMLRYDYNTDGTAEFSVDESGNVVTTGTLAVTGATTQTGVATFTAAPVITAGYEDGYIFLGPEDAQASPVTWTLTRAAAGNCYLRRTAADAAAYVDVNLTKALGRMSATKGIKVTSLDYVFNITTKALDAHTITLQKATYVSGSAVSVASFGGSLVYTPNATLPTAAVTNPYTVTITPGTPVVFGATNTAQVTIEFAIDASDTSVYDFYGVGVHFTWYPL
jgi:hypothetical protein